jgi:hypothetical protein
MICVRLVEKALAVPLALGLPLAFALGLGAAACGDGGESECTVGSFGCACYPGNVCLAGLSCLSGICLQFTGEGETTGNPGDGDPGDGDPSGDGDPGDGDPGDGDPSGDGDGDPGDGDGEAGEPCDGPQVMLYSQGIPQSGDSGLFAALIGDFTGTPSVELADDFTVPQDEGCWCITQLVVRGFYSDAILPMETPDFYVEIYNDGNAVPTGTPIASDSGLLAVDDAGELTALLDVEVVVPAGTHWLSFRPEVIYADYRWYWRLMETTPGDQAAARDLDEVIFDGSCTIWTPASACFSAPQEGYEFSMQFDIIGVIGGEACN